MIDDEIGLRLWRLGRVAEESEAPHSHLTAGRPGQHNGVQEQSICEKGEAEHKTPIAVIHASDRRCEIQSKDRKDDST